VTTLLNRFAGWVIRTYGLWAARHEPYSFAIYPVLAAVGPLIVWLVVGRTAGLAFLLVFEGLTAVLWVWLLRRRKRLIGGR
jgi:hypothetical protein